MGRTLPEPRSRLWGLEFEVSTSLSVTFVGSIVRLHSLFETCSGLERCLEPGAMTLVEVDPC